MANSEEKTSYADEKGSADPAVEQVEQSPPSATEFEATPEEKRLVRKLDMRIMPIACIMYLFACEYRAFCVLVSDPSLHF